MAQLDKNQIDPKLIKGVFTETGDMSIKPFLEQVVPDQNLIEQARKVDSSLFEKMSTDVKDLAKKFGIAVASVMAAQAAYNLARGYFKAFKFRNSGYTEKELTRNMLRKVGVPLVYGQLGQELIDKYGANTPLIKIRAISVPFIDNVYTVVGVNKAIDSKDFNMIKGILDDAFKKMRLFDETDLLIDLASTPIREPLEWVTYDEAGWMDDIISVATTSYLLPRTWLTVDDIVALNCYKNA